MKVNNKKSFKFSSSSRIESTNFLKLKYKSKEYLLDEFMIEFPNKNEHDTILKNCSIIYRGNEVGYSAFWDEMKSIGKGLVQSKFYIDEIVKNENNTLINDFDLYRGGRFVHKAENCLEIACYYLFLSAQYFPTINSHNWENGYYFYFYERTNHLLSSIIWYNNCFDYILQIVYLSQSLYLNNSKLSANSKIDTIIKKCTFDSVKHGLKKDVTNNKYQQLLKVLEALSISHNEIRELANSIKHRGGVSVNGLEPKKMYEINLLDENGEVTHSSRELEEVKELNIDIDTVLPLLYDEHTIYVNAIREIVNIIYDLKI